MQPAPCQVARPDATSRRDVWGRQEQWGFRRSVERANIRAVHAQALDASGAATPYIGRRKLAPTTVVRARAQTKYSKHSRAAYGHHRSRAGAPRRRSSTKSPAPHTDRPRDAGLPLTMSSLADLNNSLHQTISGYRLEVRRTRTAGGLVTNVVRRCSLGPDGSPLVQQCALYQPGHRSSRRNALRPPSPLPTPLRAPAHETDRRRFRTAFDGDPTREKSLRNGCRDQAIAT